MYIPPAILERARTKAQAACDNKVWPVVYFLKNGEGRPRQKRYLRMLRRVSFLIHSGRRRPRCEDAVEHDQPFELGTQSWSRPNRAAIQTRQRRNSTKYWVQTHGFQFIKPLKLMSKIIRIWCPPNGIILDPYAGSGTTGHATLELNHERAQTADSFSSSRGGWRPATSMHAA